MRRVVSLWLPDFATAKWIRSVSQAKGQDQRAARDYSQNPLALIAQDGNRLVLRACNAAAIEAGLQPGLSLNDARAMLPSLITQPHDSLTDRKSARQLAQWLERYTPWTALDQSHPTEDGGQSFWLDVTGCAHLFGGEAMLLGNIQNRLMNLGYASRLGLADTAGMAWAAARFLTTPKDPSRLLPPGVADEVLPQLPLDALRLSPSALELAERFGLQTIADLMALPRAGLARRFGGEIAQRLAQALGEEQEPLSPRQKLSLINLAIS